MTHEAWFMGKTVVITGASQGIGRAMAIQLTKMGASVLAAARNQDGLDETVRMAGSADGSCTAYRLDLADTASVAAFSERIEGEGKAVDVLINNAADVTSKPFLDTSVDEIEHLVRTNVTGMLQLTRVMAVQMASRGEGVIVNISSLAGYKPNTAQTVYSITKSAVNGASEALFAELRAVGVHVLNVPFPPIGDGAGQTPVARAVGAVADAISRKQCELFLHRRSRWLMRLYRAWPALSRLR